MFNAGSPKKISAPWFCSSKILRCIAPMLAVDTRPYSVLNSEALSPTNCIMDRKSLISRIGNPLSSAILNITLSVPVCVSLRFKIRLKRSGPISVTVVRIGCPDFPNKSQKTTGNPWKVWLSILSFLRRCASLSFGFPGLLIPDRSPFTSAINTGMPAKLKFSAITCKVTVLPVPVAPAINPCRFAICGMIKRSFSPLAMSSGAFISFLQCVCIIVCSITCLIVTVNSILLFHIW